MTKKLDKLPTNRPTRLKAYYLPHGDGLNDYIVCAKNQREACKALACSIYCFKLYGGHEVPFDFNGAKEAKSTPEIPWLRRSGTKEPWHCYGVLQA